jgi:hypothetical protein
METGKEPQRGKSLPKEYKWDSRGAKREKKKGTATAGIIKGVKLGIKEKRQEKREKVGKKSSYSVINGGK